jgi:GT2 family glycosyltransferase
MGWPMPVTGPISGPVTVVVATRDRVEDLARSLLHHRCPVVLVDNGSSDGTPAWVRRRHPEVRVIELARNLGAVARNVGVRAAGTPYVAFADDDSWWAPGALELATAHLERHPRLGLLAAAVRVGPEERLDPTSRLMADSPLGTDPDLPGPSVLGFLACGAVVRREAFLGAGGFDPVVHFGGEEERLALDLAAAGWGLAYVPEVVAHHHPARRGRPPATSARARLVRNRVLTSVMRRPWPVVAATALGAVGAGTSGVRGLATAVPRLPAAVARRRVLPPAVEARRRSLGD